MNVRRASRTLAAVALAVGLTGSLAASAQAAQPASDAKNRGSVTIVFDETLVPQLFKAGVFMYGAESVSVARGNSGALSLTFPLEGTSTSKPTTAITVDGEVGGISFINGPAEVTAGLISVSVRRTGRTGVVNGEIIGPFSTESGQFEKKMQVFTMSAATARRTAKGWRMDATLTLTPQAATTLNTLLKTTVFTSSAPSGELQAEVSTS